MLANAVAMDIAAGYMLMLKRGIRYDFLKADVHTCSVHQRLKHAKCSREEVGDLRMFGLGVDNMDIDVYAKADILGTPFHAGQWGRPHSKTCSSVITCVIAGRSVYGYVRKFLQVDGVDCPGYASVSWFGPPQYPRGSNRLEVVVSRDGGEGVVGSCIIRLHK